MRFDSWYWILFSLLLVGIEVFIRYNITSCRKYKRHKASIVAMCAQFLWVFLFLMTKQYILTLLCVVDFCIWGRGVIRNRPAKREKKQIGKIKV